MGEVWQEVDCPQHDVDLHDDDVVHAGQQFYCVACGGTHIAVAGLVETYIETEGLRGYPDLPATAGDLRQLREAVRGPVMHDEEGAYLMIGGARIHLYEAA